MEKFIPFEKLSKKKKQEINRMKRHDWKGINPVTRRSENKKAYNRKKIRRNYDDYTADFYFIFYFRMKLKFCLMHALILVQHN